jgi:hypothetical protein
LSGLASGFEHDGSLQPRGALHEHTDLSCLRQYVATTFHRGHNGALVCEKTRRCHIRIVAGFAAFVGGLRFGLRQDRQHRRHQSGNYRPTRAAA